MNRSALSVIQHRVAERVGNECGGSGSFNLHPASVFDNAGKNGAVGDLQPSANIHGCAGRNEIGSDAESAVCIDDGIIDRRAAGNIHSFLRVENRAGRCAAGGNGKASALEQFHIFRISAAGYKRRAPAGNDSRMDISVFMDVHDAAGKQGRTLDQAAHMEPGRRLNGKFERRYSRLDDSIALNRRPRHTDDPVEETCIEAVILQYESVDHAPGTYRDIGERGPGIEQESSAGMNDKAGCRVPLHTECAVFIRSCDQRRGVVGAERQIQHRTFFQHGVQGTASLCDGKSAAGSDQHILRHTVFDREFAVRIRAGHGYGSVQIQVHPCTAVQRYSDGFSLADRKEPAGLDMTVNQAVIQTSQPDFAAGKDIEGRSGAGRRNGCYAAIMDFGIPQKAHRGHNHDAALIDDAADNRFSGRNDLCGGVQRDSGHSGSPDRLKRCAVCERDITDFSIIANAQFAADDLNIGCRCPGKEIQRPLRRNVAVVPIRQGQVACIRDPAQPAARIHHILVRLIQLNALRAAVQTELQGVAIPATDCRVFLRNNG